MKFFCAQCRTDREIEKFEEFRTKHNLPMAKANCPICGSELFRKLDVGVVKGKRRNKK